MKILQLTSCFPCSEQDASLEDVYELSKRMVNKGIDLKVLTPRVDSCSELKVDTYRFPYFFASWEVFGKLPGILESLRKNKLLSVPLLAMVTSAYFHTLKEEFDILHSQVAVPMGFVGSLVKPVKRKPLVITCHGSDLNTESLLIKTLVRSAFKRADVITTVSEKLRERAIELGANSQKVKTLLHGIDPLKFDKSKFDVKKLRQKYGIPKDKLVLGALCRFIPGKFVSDFIKIMPRLNKKFDCYFVLVGDGPEMPRLQGLARELEVDNVSFQGFTNVPQEFYPVFDIFVFPSIYEGLPSVVQEAMSSMCTCVVSREVGSELIEDGVNGYLFQGRNLDSLFEKTVQAINRRTGRAARKKVLVKFDRGKCVDRFIELYKSLV